MICDKEFGANDNLVFRLCQTNVEATNKTEGDRAKFVGSTGPYGKIANSKNCKIVHKHQYRITLGQFYNAIKVHVNACKCM